MSYMCVSLLILNMLLQCISMDQPPTLESDNQRVGNYKNNTAVPPQGNYKCKEDWGITCSQDSECCSGSCRLPFCKILGIETERPPMRRRKGQRRNKRPTQLETNK